MFFTFSQSVKSSPGAVTSINKNHVYNINLNVIVQTNFQPLTKSKVFINALMIPYAEVYDRTKKQLPTKSISDTQEKTK